MAATPTQTQGMVVDRSRLLGTHIFPLQASQVDPLGKEVEGQFDFGPWIAASLFVAGPKAMSFHGTLVLHSSPNNITFNLDATFTSKDNGGYDIRVYSGEIFQPLLYFGFFMPGTMPEDEAITLWKESVVMLADGTMRLPNSPETFTVLSFSASLLVSAEDIWTICTHGNRKAQTEEFTLVSECKCEDPITDYHVQEGTGAPPIEAEFTARSDVNSKIDNPPSAVQVVPESEYYISGDLESFEKGGHSESESKPEGLPAEELIVTPTQVATGAMSVEAEDAGAGETLIDVQIVTKEGHLSCAKGTAKDINYLAAAITRQHAVSPHGQLWAQVLAAFCCLLGFAMMLFVWFLVGSGLVVVAWA